MPKKKQPPAAAAAAKIGRPAAPPKITDHNKSWLKPKKQDLFEEEEEDEDEDVSESGEEEYSGEECSEDEEGSEEEEGSDEDEEDSEEEEESDDEESDDEDEEEEESSGDELEFERKARRTFARLQKQDAENRDELREMAEEGKARLPTAADLAEEGNAPPDVKSVAQRVKAVVDVLSDFSSKREEGRSRAEYVAVLSSDLATVYGYNPDLVELLLGLFSPAEALKFIEASETPRPVTVRTNTLKTRRRELAQALIARNVNLDPIAKWSKEGLQIYESAVPIGATPEYLAGHYMVQSASSFLPVMALGPQPGHRVLDMAAAPGGKSAHCAALMGNTGTLVSNDFSKDRLRALQANLARLGVRNAIVLNADGRDFPKLMGGFDRVLLDAPCTGLGVISKDPSVKAEKGYTDVQRCQQLQKELLLAAIDSCNANGPGGGTVVYSTCSVSIEENETVVDYALKARSVKVVETGLPFGVEGLTRHRSKRFHASLKHARRFYPHTHNMDGFFVCKLRKYSNALPAGVDGESAAASSTAPGIAPKAAKQGGKAAQKGQAAPGKDKGKPPPSAKTAGPKPTLGSARPGGGSHGDGAKRAAKRAMQQARLEQQNARGGHKGKRPRKA